MLAGERRARIIEALRQGGGLTVAELAADVGVSESTVRRDLGMLDRNGKVTRTYGGALPLREAAESVTDTGRPERRWDPRHNIDVKSRMAEAAAALVADGESVLLDIGTTTPLIARALRGRPVTIITGNLAVLDEVRDDPAITLVLLGGLLRRNYQSLVGAMAGQAIAQVNADVLFLSCSGVKPNGQVVDDIALEAALKQSMIDAASRVVLLASHLKFPGSGALVLCSIVDVDVVVTTSENPDSNLAAYRSHGGEVVTA